MIDRVAVNAVAMQFDGRAIRVISLEDLLTVKESVRRPKDLEVAAELRALMDARRAPKL
ncbi:MAG: hypothetical protein Q8S33_36010 [Myxococcales bacterium]|nr:hypothetical protein [Myxococcales bacterium]MDP3505805.1 hypothetical protein [Myxococcales bacterium]